MGHVHPVKRDRRLSAWLLIVPGAICYLALGLWLADGLPTWHEEVSIQSNLGYRVLPDDVNRPSGGALPVEPWCGDGAPHRFVVSRARPTLTLCAGGRAYPIMTMSYASGVFSWPMLVLEPVHHDDVFVQRKIGLVRGLLALVLLFSMVRRIGGDVAAGLSCLLASVSAPFVYPHVFLFPYETLPWTLAASAFWVWSGIPELSPAAPKTGPPPAWGRLLVGASLLGLAVLANAKALFIIAAFVLAALVAGVRVRRIRAVQWLAVLAIATIACAPLWIFARIDPAAGLSNQVGRLSFIARKARLDAFVAEAENLLTFGSDVGFYLEQVGGKPGTLFIPGLVAVAFPIGYVVVAALSRVFRRPIGSTLASTCGVILASYFFVSLLLYDQFPSANYAPMHCVFGAAYAAFCVDAGRGVAKIAGVSTARVTGAMAALLAVVLVVATVRRGDPARYMITSINAEAERKAARYLLDHPAAGEILTTSYNLAGVVEALGQERLHPIQAQVLLERCRGRVGEALFTCVEQRLHWILGHQQSMPMRFLLPALVTGADSPVEVNRVVPDALDHAVAELGLSMSLESSFSTRGGDEVLRLYSITTSK